MDIVVGALQEQGLTVLFIEHDMDVISRYAERVVAFYDGEILVDGPTAQVLADPAVRERVIGESVTRTRKESDGVNDAAH